MRPPEHSPNALGLLSARPGDFGAAIGDPRYREVIRKFQGRYYPWSKLRYRAQAEHLDPEMLWAIVKMSRLSQCRYLPLLGEDGVRLQFNTPDVLQEELMLIDQQLAGRILSHDDQPLSPAHQERFIISALREEAIASSMLEGAATTRHDAKEMLASGRKPRTRGERMVLNNYQAMSYIREHRSSPLTPDLLLHVQRTLTANTLDDENECGRFRTSADGVNVVDQYGTVLHRPPPADELPARLDALCAFANRPSTDGGFIHPVISACVIHFQLGFDHPFCDGNGRTARTIFYWAMLRAGYWLFEYLPISRLIYAGPSRYAMAFLNTESDEFDVTYFLAYKARIIARARKELGEYITRKQIEMAAGRKVFESDHRLNHRQRDLILRMLRNPDLTISIQDHGARQQIAYATARGDLLDLAEWNYLSKVLVRNKRFEFVRGPKLDAVRI